MALSSTNARSERRAKSDRTARVQLGLFRRRTCQVSDLSASGAKLTFEKPVKNFPKRFQLTLSGSGVTRQHMCICRWHDGNTAGVEFLFD